MKKMLSKQSIVAITVAAALLTFSVCSCGTAGSQPATNTQSTAAQNETTTAEAATESTAASTTAAASSKAGAQTETTATEQAAASKEAVELDLFVDVPWLFDYFNCTPETRTGKVILEKTNVSVKFSKSKTNDNSQVSLMLASDDLPDLVCVDSNSSVFPALRESGKVLDLIPLIENYAPEFYDIMGEQYWNFYKSDTGINNYYGTDACTPKLLARSSTFNGGAGGLFVREDLWNAMGGEGIDITTPEKLKTHLISVKEKYPDIKPILIHPTRALGLISVQTGGLAFWQHAFGIEGYYEAPDGKLICAYNNPEYAKFLCWLNGMYREGFYTREDMDRSGESRASVVGQADLYMYYDSEINALAYPPTGHPETNWTAAPVFKTSKMTIAPGLFWCATFISSKCKNPEAAIKLMSYCASPEGDRLNYWGQEGIDWEWDANGAPIRTQNYVDAHVDSVDSANYDNARGVVFGFRNGAEAEWYTLSLPNDPPYMKRARTLYQDYYFIRLNYLNIYPTGNIPESVIMQQCNDYFQEMLPQIIMADSESSCLEVFETMKKELAKKGIAEGEAYFTKQSNRTKDAFGADNLVNYGADNVLFHKLYG